MRRCSRCKTEKPLSEFHTIKGRPDCYCWPCRKEYRRSYYLGTDAMSRRRHVPGGDPLGARRSELKAKYGISLADYNDLSDEQGGRCAICRKAPDGKGSNGRLNVDHDHETGLVRGLLCLQCNHGLGKFLDDPRLLYAAASYLASNFSLRFQNGVAA